MFSLILLFFVYLHSLATLGNNFYFTIDQGSDAIHARDIWHNKTLFLKGPETSIRGVFAGPLWYYFITPGLVLFNGHPIGSLYTLLILNLILLSLIFWWITQKINIKTAFLVTIPLAFSWHFFQTSLYTFNPFPTVTITFILFALLLQFLNGAKRYYIFSILLSLFAFNFDVATATVLTLFTFVIGAYGYKKRILSLKAYLVQSFFFPALALMFLAKQFFTIFMQTKVITEQSAGLGVFTGTNIATMTAEFIKIVGHIIPQNEILGCIIFAIAVYYFYKRKKKDKTIYRIVGLTLALIALSFIFFASNKGWRSWHTVYLFPVIYASFIVMATQLKKKYATLILAIVFLAQVLYFQESFTNYKKPSDDPSLLYNELSAVDWVYKNSEEQGFKVYTYTDRFYDDNYQYLFWWHGLETYGYLPDEYANYPLAAKELYVPNYTKYAEPKRGSDRISFLIVQSDTNGETNKDWINKFRDNHDLKESTKVGDITIEKYYRKNNATSDFCLWWNRCD